MKSAYNGLHRTATAVNCLNQCIIVCKYVGKVGMVVSTSMGNEQKEKSGQGTLCVFFEKQNRAWNKNN